MAPICARPTIVPRATNPRLKATSADDVNKVKVSHGRHHQHDNSGSGACERSRAAINQCQPDHHSFYLCWVGQRECRTNRTGPKYVADSSRLLRRSILDELLEARILAERIEHRIESE